jgi:hypothetical protein
MIPPADAPDGRGAGDPVRQQSEGGADAVERVGVTEHPRRERHAVLLVIMQQELGVERRQVDGQRALGLARLALDAEVDYLVEPPVA